MSKKPEVGNTADKASSQKATLAFGSLNGKIEAAADSVGMLKEQSLSSYECKACKTVSVAQTAFDPYCVACGSHHVVRSSAVTATAVLSSVVDKDLASVVCGGCHQSTVLSATDLKAHKNAIHCVICGTKTEVAAVEGTEQQDSLTIQEADTPEVKQAPATETVKIENAAADCDDDKKEDDKEGNPFGKKEEASSEPFGGKQAPPFKAKSDLSEMVDDVGDDGFEDIDDVSDDGMDEADVLTDAPDDEDFDGVDEVNEFDEMVEEAPLLSSADITVSQKAVAAKPEDELHQILDEMIPVSSAYSEGDPLMDTLEMDDKAANVALFHAEDSTTVLMKNNVAIATLTQKAAGKNADVVKTKAYAAAITAMAETEGLRQTMKRLGFSPICVKTISKSVLKKQVEQVTATADKKVAAYQQEFAESLVLAAVGMARGQWREHPDPMVASFAELIQSFGVASEKKAMSLARSTASENSEKYARSIITLASMFAEKGPEFRKNLQDTFQLTVAAADDADDEDEEDEDKVESSVASRLAASFVPVEPQTVVARQHHASILNKPLKFNS